MAIYLIFNILMITLSDITYNNIFITQNYLNTGDIDGIKYKPVRCSDEIVEDGGSFIEEVYLVDGLVIK